MKGLSRRLPATFFLATTLLASESLPACTVCFGDPASDMVKGANAGILVLLGIVVAVLGAIGSVSLFWMRRARLYDRTLLARQAATGLGGYVGVDLPAGNGKSLRRQARRSRGV